MWNPILDPGVIKAGSKLRKRIYGENDTVLAETVYLVTMNGAHTFSVEAISTHVVEEIPKAERPYQVIYKSNFLKIYTGWEILQDA